MIIKKGTIFLLTNGEYSDYDALTICRADTDIDIMALKSEYIALHPEQGEPYKFERFQFVSWLIVNRGVCQELDYQEWYIGSYNNGNFEIREQERWVESSAV